MNKVRSAVVTGGASGLGLATVRRLAQRYRVVIADLQEPPAVKNATFVKCDVLEETSVRAVFEAAENPEVLVNCAGIGLAKKTLSKGKAHDLESFERVLKINCVGTFNTVRIAAEKFPNGGCIVNTASIAAYDGQRGQAAYAASKGAIAAMTLPLARDLASLSIRVVTIAPGLFLTPLLEGLPPAVQSDLASHVPFPNRLGHPDEFAHLVDAVITNPMLNGEVIRLDGALRMPPG